MRVHVQSGIEKRAIETGVRQWATGGRRCKTGRTRCLMSNCRGVRAGLRFTLDLLGCDAIQCDGYKSRLILDMRFTLAQAR